jgi:hypothetical protein
MADKTASLVFFYFGESSYVNKIAQETVPLHLAMEDYDHKVLLRHEVDIGTGNGKIELSEQAEKLADVVDLPTRENLAAQLNRLRDEGYVVDVFIFSHGWTDRFRTSTGTYGDNTSVSQNWLEGQVKEPLKIRMVWQCNCYGSTLNDMWTNLGAKASAGSRFVSFYPTRFKGFIKLWRAGKSFDTCLEQSDTKMVHTPPQIFMVFEAIRRAKEWGGTFWQGFRILGNNNSSQQFFRECWNGDDVPKDKSGQFIMNDSSKMLVAGDGDITVKSELEW